MIPPDFIQTLLGRVDIVDVIDRHVKLKKAGANMVACCPFHTEKSPSFTVSPSKQFYHCFGCGANGSALGFVMEFTGATFVEAVESLAQSAGMAVPHVRGDSQGQAGAAFQPRKPEASLVARMRAACDFYRQSLKQSPVAIDYCKSRGLTGEVAARYGLGYAPDEWQSLQSIWDDYDAPELVDTGLVIDSEATAGKPARRYDRFRNRVMFPIFDSRGSVIGFGGRVLGAGEPKYLNSPETPLFEKGRELYGLWQAKRAIRDTSQVVVVEGYMDVVALAQFGVENAVATLGTATTTHHIQRLVRLADHVVFAFDGDAPGQKAAWRALETALPQVPDGKRVSFLFLPEEDDPDTYVRRHGKAGFSAAIEASQPLSELLVERLLRDHPVQTPEGKARFIEAAKPLLAAMAAPLLRHFIESRMAEVLQVSRSDLATLMPLSASPKPKRTEPDLRGARANRRVHPKSARILALLLRYPTLASKVSAALAASSEFEPVAEIVRFMAESDDSSVGILVECFTEHADCAAALNEAIKNPLFADEQLTLADAETTIDDFVERELKDERKERLLAKMLAGSLTPDERTELAHLNGG
jgi:DNA primase